MKTEEERALRILMVLLFACEPVHLGVTSKHSLLLIRGYPALQQGPAGCAANYPPQHQHNGAIIAAVTLRLDQTAQLYLGIQVTYSQPINLLAMSPNKGLGVGGGGRVYVSTHFHYIVVYVFRWGMGSTWLRLHPPGCALGLGGSL